MMHMLFRTVQHIVILAHLYAMFKTDRPYKSNTAQIRSSEGGVKVLYRYST